MDATVRARERASERASELATSCECHGHCERACEFVSTNALQRASAACVRACESVTRPWVQTAREESSDARMIEETRGYERKKNMDTLWSKIEKNTDKIAI